MAQKRCRPGVVCPCERVDELVAGVFYRAQRVGELFDDAIERPASKERCVRELSKLGEERGAMTEDLS